MVVSEHVELSGRRDDAVATVVAGLLLMSFCVLL
jgi:hypothetical protein